MTTRPILPLTHARKAARTAALWLHDVWLWHVEDNLPAGCWLRQKVAMPVTDWLWSWYRRIQ